MYVSVVINNKSSQTDKFFTYKCNFENIEIGDKVIVPFGIKDSLKEGYVTGLLKDIEDLAETFSLGSKLDKLAENEFIIKSVASIDKKESIGKNSMELALWMKREYFVKYVDCIRLFTPWGKENKKRPPINTVDNYKGNGDTVDKLTDQQKDAVDKIENAIEEEKEKVFLLDGVTGSGKTEVYIKSVEKALSIGKTAIVMVPEITLTKQVIDRFVQRFGKDKIAVIHSKLSKGELYSKWQEIKNGERPIVLGARTAVFAPLRNIGVIVLDEEHDMSYKSQTSPKFHVRDIAIRRGKIENSTVILGSATPTLESIYRSVKGEYELLTLSHRYNFVQLPKVEIADMRNELKEGNTSIFSRKLYDGISSALESDKQVMLIVGRRGYSSFVSCRSCGHVIKCNKCNVPMKYLHKDSILRCGYCGIKKQAIKTCPNCGSQYIKHFGIGTETVEEQVKKYFPNSKTKILDLDYAKTEKKIREIIDDFERGEVDILIGTQMISKGLDFKNVQTVGIIAADMWLNSIDYRGRERCFQNIVHSSGRAGRGEERGNVIVQTYKPNDFAIVTGAQQSNHLFFQKEIEFRKSFKYPPYSEIYEIVLQGKKFEKMWKRCKKLEETIANKFGKAVIFDSKVIRKTEGDSAVENSWVNEEKNSGEDRKKSKKSDNTHKITILLKMEEMHKSDLLDILEKFRDEIRKSYDGISVILDFDPSNLWRI